MATATSKVAPARAQVSTRPIRSAGAASRLAEAA